MNLQHSRVSRSRNARKGGFTLVEIIVVLIIVTLISSLVFAAFKSIREGNKKTSCQTNLAQIYKALRLYGQDFDGQFPSYNPISTASPAGAVADRAGAGLGLWALYAYPTSTALDCDGRTTRLPLTEASGNATPPLASYIKSPNVFHCPYDDYDRPVVPSAGCGLTAGAKLKSSQLEFTDNSNRVSFNPFYNSYQTTATLPANATDALNESPYSSFRTPGSSRQLVYYTSLSAPSQINERRRTPDTTIITWCRFHRKTDADGLTVERPSNSDNVLFMDGTVQFLPTKQDIGTSTGANACPTWTRAPLEAVPSLSNCQNQNF